MPPEMAVSMRQTKLKAEEAALIAGEVTKPSWESRNEGIHERVSFEDTIWGFDLAGGSYYNTPLRVTFVKPDSRAEKAGIRPGDRLLRINGVETSSLTIQEAHDLILKAGLHLQINVTAPEDETDAYYCYEDPIIDEYEAELERLRAEEAARRQSLHAGVNSYWSLQWPWVCKRKIIWRESNCFMVPSKYEEKHKDKFSGRSTLRREDDLVLDSVKKRRDKPPTFVRSKSYEGITVENPPELVNSQADNDVDDDNSKMNGQSQKNGYRGNLMENGDENEIDSSDAEESSVIENNHVDYKEDDSLHTVIKNSIMGTSEKVSINGDSDVNIEDIDDEYEDIEQDTDKEQELDNNNYVNQENYDVNKNKDILDEVLKEDEGVLKSEEDDIIESVLNEKRHGIDDSEPINGR